MIYGVEIRDLKIFADERGSVRHMLKSTDPHFIQFGEIYFSTVHPGVVKGWHLHTMMTLNYVCVYGEIMVGLIDLREASPTYSERMKILLADNGDNYKLLTVPPFVWNGFRSSSHWAASSIVANCATHPHDPDELERIHPDECIPSYETPSDEWRFDKSFWGDYEVAG
jgi:dTDP-4-dehydrorhamnose 3,5-epimerase